MTRVPLIYSCLFLICCSMTIGGVCFTFDDHEEYSIIKNAYAQSPGTGNGPTDPSTSDPTNPSDPGSSVTDPGASNDLSNSDISGSSGTPDQNSTIDPSLTVPDVSNDLAGPNVNSTVGVTETMPNGTANQSVPEFGPVSAFVLAISVVSIVVISLKARFLFSALPNP